MYNKHLYYVKNSIIIIILLGALTAVSLGCDYRDSKAVGELYIELASPAEDNNPVTKGYIDDKFSELQYRLAEIEIENRQIWQHLHFETFLAPLEDPIELVDGGPWIPGAFSADFIAAGAIANDFSILGIELAEPSIDGDYTVIFYAGPDDIEIGQVGFNRQGVFSSSIFRTMISQVIPAGWRIRAKLSSSAGGATCQAKVYYHVEY